MEFHCVWYNGVFGYGFGERASFSPREGGTEESSGEDPGTNAKVQLLPSQNVFSSCNYSDFSQLKLCECESEEHSCHHSLCWSKSVIFFFFLKKNNALFIHHRIDYFRIFSFMKYERKIMHIMLNNDLVLTTIYVTGDTFIPSRIFWSCLL